MCPKYVRGIGFYIWRLGMGVPIEEDENDEEVKEQEQ